MTCIEFAENMYNILSWLSKLLNIEIEYWKIDCNTKKTIREKIINNFKKSTKISIIINVHILDEGVNILECDSVFISQPSNNITNIIQRMCRANRIYNDKNSCNIYLWCNEKKTNIILNYINDNTQGFIKDKVFIFNTDNKIIKKYDMHPNIKKNIIYNTNTILSKHKLIEFINANNLVIDIKFVNDFFEIYNKNDDNLIINIEMIIKWINMTKGHIKDTLIYSYKENIDYKIIKGISTGLKGKPKDIIMITPKCLKLLLFRSKTKKVINFQEQYFKLENIIYKLLITIAE